MRLKNYQFTVAASIALLAGIFALSAPLSRSAEAEVKQATQPGDAEPKTLAQELIGTWILEEAVQPGSPSGIGSRLKMFTGTHWSVIQPDLNTGVILFQHGGRYRLDGDTVKTNRDFAGESTKSLIGTAGELKITIKGDMMKQSDSKGVYNEDLETRQMNVVRMEAAQ